MDISASAAAPGEAVVVESTTVKGLGNVADCVVRWGTLKQGDYFVVGLTVRCLLRGCTVYPSDSVQALTFPKSFRKLMVFTWMSRRCALYASASVSARVRVGISSLCVLLPTQHGRVRSLLDSTGARIKEAPPSTPVRVVGLTDFPKAGTDLLVVPSEDAAKGILEGRSRREVFHVRPL